MEVLLFLILQLELPQVLSPLISLRQLEVIVPVLALLISFPQPLEGLELIIMELLQLEQRVERSLVSWISTF